MVDAAGFRSVVDDRMEGSEAYFRRARASMEAAEAEPLTQRAKVHLDAANQWSELGRRAKLLETIRARRKSAG